MLTKTQTVGRYSLEGVNQRMNAAMRACVSWAAIEEHDKILDMACGSGQMLAHLNDQLKLTLCGMCKDADQARAISEMLGEADVIPARMEDIPWRDNTFDVVMLPAHMKGEPKRILDEVIRVLRPGGQFVMSVQVGHGADARISFHDDTGSDERLAIVIGDSTRDDPVLGQRQSACDEHPRDGREGRREEFLELEIHKS